MKALLIIDMQKQSFTSEKFDAHGVINRINLLSNAFRSNSLPVFIIQHDGTAHGEYVRGTTGWEIIDEIVVSPGDTVVSKTANDSFYETNLDTLLRERGINDIIVTGAATDFCIDSTIQSALVKNFNVFVPSDAHTAGNRPSLSGSQVVMHYNWVWANLIPTSGSVKVQSTEEILRML